MHHGLTTNTTKNSIPVPENWQHISIAGLDWLPGFLSRKQELSICSQEATRLGMATSFSKNNVGKFFTNLRSVMERYNFPPNKIYNIDETGLMTVHKLPKVIATKGEKQVGQVTSSERGTLVTTVGTINAVGNTISPLLIFPRVHFRNDMLIGAPPDTIGATNPSGCINTSIFETWLQQFIDHSNSTEDNPHTLSWITIVHTSLSM